LPYGYGVHLGMNTRANIDRLSPADFDMAAMIEGLAWDRTPLGPSKDWPQSLTTIVDVIVNSPLPMIVLWGPSLVQIYNAGYAHICANKHPTALGQPTRDCWPEVWDFNAPIYDAVRAGEVRSFERQLLTTTRSGEPQDSWFDLTYSPVRDEDRNVAGVLVTVVESTPHVLLARSLAAAVEQGDRLRSLFERAPGFIAVLEGPDHVFDFANEAYLKLVGHRDVVGRTVREVFPELEGQGFFDLLDSVYAEGVAHVGADAPINLARSPGGEAEHLYLDFLYQPMLAGDGAVTGVFVQGTDVTDRVLAHQRQTLLMGELTHRVKNALATVLGLANLTRVTATSVESFIDSLTQRVLAMAKTQDLLTQGIWEAVLVRDVLNVELAPYVDAGGRVELRCQDMTMAATAAVNLSLVVHELLTNALKYGALSDLGGRLIVTCEGANGEATLVWSERTAQPLAEVGAPGFGSQLIERLARSLGGGAKFERAADGVQAIVNFKIGAAIAPPAAPLPPPA
jgi:two-component sensor histidine kinase